MVRKLSRGQQVKIAAKDYNRWQDAGLSHAMAKLNQQELPVAPDSLEGVILVKNTTAMHLPRFSVLGLNGSIYDPNYDTQARTEFKNQIALKGEMPSTTTAGKFCVLQNDAVPGEVVAAIVSGVTPCLLKVGTTADTHADVEIDPTVDCTRYLKAGNSGSAQILFKPAGLLGEQLGVVRISNQRPSEVIIIHNNSGEVMPLWGLGRLTAVTVTSGVDVHEVSKPNTSFKSRYIINSEFDIPIDGYGYGTWLNNSGKVLYNTSSGTPAIDEEWGAKTAQWSIEKNRPGFHITGGNETDGGVFRTRARQRIVTDLIGKADSSISKGGTGTVSIYMGASGAEAATEYDITCSALGTAMTGSKWAVVFFREGVWYVAPWEC